MTATRGPRTLRCAGIAAVAVAPEYRSSGVGAALMTEILPQLVVAGFPLASLYAFRESYYRGFGYEVCGTRYEITCPSHRFPKVRPTLEMRMLGADEMCAIRPCYESFARRFSGMNIRGEDMWWRQMGGDTPFAVYAAGDPIQAYVAVRLDAEFWVPQEVREFVWTSPEGYRAGLALIGSLGINKTHAVWHEPGDSPFLQEYMDYEVQAKLHRPIMFRVLSVPGALGALASDASGEFTLGVEDRLLPANSGPWRVAYGAEGVCVERCENAEIETDIRSFTQALLGEPDFESLLVSGRIRAKSPAHAAAARRLLAPRRIYCVDFF